jgi:membrane-associated phospholipid phosphatase
MPAVRIINSLIILAIVSYVSPATAQESTPTEESHPTRSGFVRDFFHDEYRMWTGPLRGGSYESHTMRKYGLPFLIITAGLIASDNKTANLLPNTESQAVWSGRVSQIGAPYTLAGMAGATWLIGKAAKDRHATETGWIGLDAIAHSQLLVFGLKEITQRQRPLATNPHGVGFWHSGDSFPSGHAAGAFALATVFAFEYHDHIAVPITAYSLASVVAVSRMSARRHWVSDIFVGSSLGFLVGRYVYKQHHDPTLPGSPGKRRAKLMPAVGFSGTSAALGWRL